MSDPVSLDRALPREDADQDPPQFGLLDMVEAFTAMRHEYRGQAKEGRELALQLQASTDEIRQLEAKLKSLVACHSTDETHHFVRLITELDTQLTRAVDATIKAEAGQRKQRLVQQSELRNVARSMSAIGRWSARRLIQQIESTNQADDETPSVAEGLSMLLARLREMLRENDIERLDTVGLPFDAEVMNSIGTVESSDLPAGHVVEQISPGYRWRGNMLRFADVRISAKLQVNS